MQGIVQSRCKNKPAFLMKNNTVFNALQIKLINNCIIVKQQK